MYELIRRNVGPWLLAGLLGAVPAQAQLAAPDLATATAPLVFRGVTVIDVQTGQRLPDQAVVVVGNRIQAITPVQQARPPKGARLVDAPGKYLVPGFWDMHVHLHGYLDLDFPLLLANGITGVRDAGSIPPLAALQQWKREVATGTRVGPRLVVSGPRTFEAYDTTITTIQAKGDELRIPLAELSRAADSLKAAGADMFKTYFYSREGYFKAVKAARRAGLLVGGHIPQDRNSGQQGLVGGLEASDSGATFLDHDVHPCLVFDDPHPAWKTLPPRAKVGRRLDAAPCAAAVERFRRNNSWSVVAPVFGPDSLTGQPSEAVLARIRARIRRYLPDSINDWKIRSDSAARADARLAVHEPRSTADWTLRQRLPEIEQLIADSVPMLLGTDMLPLYLYITPGFALHEAMEVLALHGASPLTVLQTVTLNPAKALRATDSLGSVAAGKVADLVLLDADPLADVWNTTKIQAVVANGRYYDRRALDELLKAAERAARTAPPFPK